MSPKISKLFENDFRTAFVIGIVQYAIVNLIQGSNIETTWYIRLTAHAISAIISVAMVFAFIKITRKVLKDI
ncbi:hypothetical protein [Bacillus mycoides]|uniref:hypothetical protein n=1 Tax=Bacillus mycoides TaxID=1405 RepID=UPI000BF5D9C8|nr:hypothetical protein [Bacillus mycoides]PGA05543.1 hypothetical protein COL71_25330 [Bacillus mycoides]